MDWDDMRIFLAVARGESLSAAGRKLGVDASTVGRRIARLEQSLGAKLFVKTPQGYELAAEGLRLVPHAEAAETALQGASEALSGQDELTGQLRIGDDGVVSRELVLRTVPGRALSAPPAASEPAAAPAVP